jgi:hypothetical protein
MTLTKTAADERELNNVRYCPSCKCKTWHCDDACEWSDMHQASVTVSTPPPDKD